MYKFIKSQKNRNAGLQCIQNKNPYIRPCQWELYLESVAGFFLNYTNFLPNPPPVSKSTDYRCNFCKNIISSAWSHLHTLMCIQTPIRSIVRPDSLPRRKCFLLNNSLKNIYVAIKKRNSVTFEFILFHTFSSQYNNLVKKLSLSVSSDFYLFHRPGQPKIVRGFNKQIDLASFPVTIKVILPISSATVTCSLDLYCDENTFSL